MIARIKKYGVDAPIMVLSYLVIGGSALSFAIFSTPYSGKAWTVGWGIFFLLGGIIALHTSLYGKSKIWDRILKDLNVESNDTILDLGTGHGLVLIKLAKKLGKMGKITGIDIWNNKDQLNNTSETLQHNISVANIRCDYQIDTGDIRILPYDDSEFDIVTSSFVIHNIKGRSERAKALKEADRVLKGKGTLVIVDTNHKCKEYTDVLSTLGFSIEVKRVGINGWWTGPWMASYAIIAVKHK